MKKIQKPYALFIGDAPDMLAAKTAIGVRDWRPDDCIGQVKLSGCAIDLGLESLTIEEAANRGAKTLMIGVANRGGVIPNNWLQTMLDALNSGMDIASGLHTHLNSINELSSTAAKLGRQLFDVRIPDKDYPIANGKQRSGHRLLAVGTDCSVGKMYTTLAIEAEMKRQGWNATFRATGQTGIFIQGSGVPVDAVISDFIAGSIEVLTTSNSDDHWDIIEGQGSLFHPSYAGVSLGLLHGAQADFLILCHEPTRLHMRGLPEQKLPGIQECLDLNQQMAQVVSGNSQFAGISVNTQHLDDDKRSDYLLDLQEQYGLPCIDPMITGVKPLLVELEKRCNL